MVSKEKGEMIDNKMWTVYGLTDPENGWVFYVGISRNVRKRLDYHIKDRNSPAREYCRFIKGKGQIPFIVEFGWHRDRKNAHKQEAAIICCMQLVYNQTHQIDSEAFWRGFHPILNCVENPIGRESRARR